MIEARSRFDHQIIAGQTYPTVALARTLCCAPYKHSKRKQCECSFLQA